MSDIKLSWTDPATLVDDKAIPANFFDHVDVQLSADAGANFTSIGSASPGAQTYTVTDLPPGTYNFNVYAVDKLGRASAVASIEKTIAVPVPAVLNPVTNLVAEIL